MQSIIKAGELLEQSSKTNSQTETILVPLEQRSGFAFAICNIANTDENSYLICKLIREHIERLANTFGGEANAQHRFEQFLSALNEHVSHEVKSGNWEFPVNELSVVVGIANDDEMYLSGTGDLTILFLHKTPTQRYQIFNLSRNIQTEQALPNWEKPFAVLLDGELKQGDVFCVASIDLQQKLPADELNSILATLPPKSAIAKIRQYFPLNIDLALLILQAADNYETYGGDQQKSLSELSVDEFNAVEQQTDEILEDQKPKLVAGLVKRLARSKKDKKDAPAKVSLRRKFFPSIKWIAKMLFAVVQIFAKMGKNISRSSLSGALSLTKKDNRSQRMDELKTRADKSVTHTVGSIKKLPKPSKYLIISALGILLVFAFSLSLVSKSRARAAEQNDYLAQIEMIQQKNDEAQAAIIYKDEDRARALYDESEGLIGTLPLATPEREEDATELRAQISAGMDEIRHIVYIPEPPVVAELDQIQGKAIVMSEESLIVFGADKQAYRVNVNEKKLEKIETTGEIGIPVKASVGDYGIYVMDNTQSLFSLDEENGEWEEAGLSADEGQVWKDFEHYGKRFYMLQTKPKPQIVRFTPVDSGFSSGNEWIQSNTTSLHDAVDLIIDGTIFVLKQNGQVARFDQGSEIGWDLGKVDPPVASATRFWTDIDFELVYVLEPLQKRVLVYRKQNGQFIEQYVSDAFESAKDLYIDKETRTLYILADTKLHAISLSK